MSQVGSRVFDFTLTLEGPDEFTVEMADALYEAGCDDASFGTSNGVHYGTFHREAPSYDEAIAAARADIERAGVGFRVVRVEAEDVDDH